MQLQLQTNTSHGNVVRVAPRLKNIPTYTYNLANNAPTRTFSMNLNPNTTQTNSVSSSGISIENTNETNGSASGSGGLIIRRNTLKLNPFLVKCSAPMVNFGSKSNDTGQKFNTLKTVSVKRMPQFYSMRLNKCKRHQLPANEPNKFIIINNGNSNSNVHSKNINGSENINRSINPNNITNNDHTQTDGKVNGMPYMTEYHVHLENCDNPLYENLTDSIQIHESFLQNDELTFNVERKSIHRSDSGISNSSYECVTPVPAPRTSPKRCFTVPVYMNLPTSTVATLNPLTRNGAYSSKRYVTKGKGAIHFIKTNNTKLLKHSQSFSNDDNSAVFNPEVCVLLIIKL